MTSDTLQPGDALSSQSLDMAHINQVEERVSEILESKVARAIDEVGNILLKEFFNDKPECYRARNGKHPSLKELLKRCGSKGIFCKRTFLANALLLAVGRHEVKSAAYHQLSPSHRTEMLRIDTTAGAEQMAEFNALADRAYEEEFTVLAIRQEVKRINHVEPKAKEVTVQTFAAFFAKLHDKKHNPVGFKKGLLEDMSLNDRLDLLHLLSGIEGYVGSLREIVEQTIPSPGDETVEALAKEKASSKPKPSAKPSRHRDGAKATPPAAPLPKEPLPLEPSVAEKPAPVVVPSAAPPVLAAPPVPPEAAQGEARKPYLEDLMAKQAAAGVDQLVILRDGAFGAAPGGPEAISPFAVFVVDLSAGDASWSALANTGFDPKKPALVTAIDLLPYREPSVSVAVYRWVHTLAAGSTLAMTLMLPPTAMPPALQAPCRRLAAEDEAAGRPVRHSMTLEAAFDLAEGLGLHRGEHISSAELAERQGDGTKARLGELILIATA